MVRSARRLVFMLLMAALAGAVLLSSPAVPAAGESQAAGPDGSAGPANPVLRAILDLTTFNHCLPTEPADRIKSLMLRGGATAMMVVALIAWGLSVRRPGRSARGGGNKAGTGSGAGGKTVRAGGAAGLESAERASLLEPVTGPEAIAGEEPGQPGQPGQGGRGFLGRIFSRRGSPTLLGWAGLIGVGWLTWSVVVPALPGSRSPREAMSFAEVFAFVLALAAVVGATLDRTLVRRACSLWLCTTSVISGLVVWRALDPAAPFMGADGTIYQPTADRSLLAASRLFVGDSRELAGLLVPSFVLAVVLLAWRWSERSGPDDLDPAAQRAWRARRRLSIMLYCIAALVTGGAIFCCGSGPWRTSLLATIAGLGVSAVLLARGRRQILWAIGAAVVTPAIGWLLIATDRPAATVAPDDLPRIIADRPMIDAPRWALAGELIGRRPMLGNGPWASRLLVDRLAQARSLIDPRWSGRPVGSVENFWLEQLADLGVVGVGLLLGALVLLAMAASQAIDRCRWRQHRWLIAALVGGLIGLAVQEFFASSGVRPGFAAVAAAWVGLAAAATRWSARPEPAPDDDPYTIGFYRGGLFFLAGAAVMLGAIGFVVVKDWTSARGHYQAVAEDFRAIDRTHRQIQAELRAAVQAAAAGEPGRPIDPGWQSILRADLAQAERHVAQAEARLNDASVWSIDLEGRAQADWQRSRAAFDQVNWQVTEQADLHWAGLAESTDLIHTAQWTDPLLPAMDRLEALDTFHPAGVAELAVSLADGSLLIARGRYLSCQPAAGPDTLQSDQNRILIGEIERAVGMARKLLDQRLGNNENPYDLPAAVLREQIATPVILARRLAIPPRVADWLISRCRLSISPAGRVRLMRDALRDFTLLAGWSATWQIAVSSPDWPAVEPDWLDGLVRTELGMDIAQPALDRMLRVARRVERDPSDAWVESLDADVRNAPQTFRLAAELIVVSRRIPQPAGLTISRLTATRPDFSTGPTSQPDDDNSDLIQADRMLAAAQRLYDRDRIGSGRFAIQAIAVRLQRAQLAWFMGDKLAGEKLAAQACDRLPWVDEFHRPTVAQAAATVRAFLLAQTDRPAEARAWLMQTRFANQFSLAGFQAQLGSSWRGALTRQIVAPPAGPADLPTSQPALPAGAIDLSPLFPPPAGDSLWPTRRSPLN